MNELDAVEFIEERLSDEKGQIFLFLLAKKLMNEMLKMDDHLCKKLGIDTGLMDFFWSLEEEVCPLVSKIRDEEGNLSENMKNLMKDAKYWEDENSYIHTNLD